VVSTVGTVCFRRRWADSGQACWQRGRGGCVWAFATQAAPPASWWVERKAGAVVGRAPVSGGAQDIHVASALPLLPVPRVRVCCTRHRPWPVARCPSSGVAGRPTHGSSLEGNGGVRGRVGYVRQRALPRRHRRVRPAEAGPRLAHDGRDHEARQRRRIKAPSAEGRHQHAAVGCRDRRRRRRRGLRCSAAASPATCAVARR